MSSFRKLFFILVILLVFSQIVRAEENKLIGILKTNVKEFRDKEFHVYSDEKLDEQHNVVYTGFGPAKEGDKDLYGSCIIIYNKVKPDEVVGYFWVGGDFDINGYYFVDLNKDGKKDLLMTNGFEQVYETRVFINNLENSKSIQNNFIHVYSHYNCYADILDFNKDGYPEIMDEGVLLSVPVSDYWMPSEVVCLVIKFDEKYRKCAPEFDKNAGIKKGVTYGDSMFHKYRIVEFRGFKAIDITRKYPEFAKMKLNCLRKFRIKNQMLLKLKKEVEEYLQSIISEAGKELIIDKKSWEKTYFDELKFCKEKEEYSEMLKAIK